MDGKYGRASDKCESDADCYGEEYCSAKGTCTCRMWSPREQHSVSVYDNKMYLSGGYVSVLYPHLSACGPYACGDTDSSGYRKYMSVSYLLVAYLCVSTDRVAI